MKTPRLKPMTKSEHRYFWDYHKENHEFPQMNYTNRYRKYKKVDKK